MEDTRIVPFPDRRGAVSPAAWPGGDGGPGHGDPHRSERVQRLCSRLLGDDRKQRIRTLQCSTALLLSVVCAANMAYLAWVGYADAEAVRWWALGLVGGFACFLVVIRSGLNLKLADPSMTVAQMGYAIVFGAGAYALAGAGRGCVFPVLMVIFMFSMYSLPSGAVRGAAAFAVAVFGGTMALMAWQRPAVYDPLVEWGHFMTIAVMVPAVSLLAGHLSRLRSRLRRQKKDLALALGRIQELATRDEATGLINRRHMHDLMEQERQRGVRSGQTFCVAVLELDDYQRLRGEAGLESANLLLRRFAQEVLDVVRISDLLCRWDDNRLLLMLSNTRGPLARMGLDRLHERSQRPTGDSGEPEVPLAFSAGVIEHRAGESVAQTVARAEQAVEAAVGAGRNRVQAA
jgi:diguanylate cyclase